MQKPKLLLAVLLSASAWLQFSGCSVTGLIIGAVSDDAKPDEYTFSPSGLDSLEQGSTVEVLRIDSSTISGHYERKGIVPPEEYRMRYEEFLHSLPVGTSLPVLGDSVLILTNERYRHRTYRGRLLDFDKRVVRVHETGRTAPTVLRMDAVDTLFHATTVVAGDALRYHLNNGDIPCAGALVVTNEEGIKTIPVTDVLNVRQAVSKRGALTGLLVGAAIDVMVAAIIATTYEPMRFDIGTGMRW